MLKRRTFIKLTTLTTSMLVLALNACKRAVKFPSEHALTESQEKTLVTIHNHLLPEGESSPGAATIRSVNFIKKILKDPQVDTEDKRLILFGINWANETAIEIYQKNFVELTHNQKEKVLQDLNTYKNGRRWISKNLTYIFEALLSDPIYGSNTNQAGWDWLKHQTGYPRPTIRTKYPFL